MIKTKFSLMRRKRKGSTRAKTKTRTRTRVVTKIRRVGSKAKRKTKKHAKSLTTTIMTIVPVVQSVQLLSHNQVSQASTTEGKLKAIVNSIGGSLFDVNLFADAPKAHFNPSIEGAFNQWSVANTVMIVGGMVAQKFKLKHANKIKRTGQISLIPSILAGVLGKNNTQKTDTFRSDSIVNTSSVSQSSAVSPFA